MNEIEKAHHPGTLTGFDHIAEWSSGDYSETSGNVLDGSCWGSITIHGEASEANDAIENLLHVAKQIVTELEELIARHSTEDAL